MQNNLHPSTFLDAEVSMFKNVKTSKSCGTTTFKEWLFNDDVKLKELVNEIRAESDLKKRKELKSNLCCITGSGVFENGRSSSNIRTHNGYIVIDIDYQDNVHLGAKYFSLIEDVFSKIDVVCYAGKSVSGNGYFLIIGIANPDKHKLHFRYIQRWFKDYNITIDKACSNVDRLRIYSYCDNFYINENATILNSYDKEVNVVRKQVSTPKYNSNSDDTVESLVKEIESKGVDIALSYEKYLRVGIALYKECGELGREHFHRICRFSSKYDERHCDKLFNNIKEKGYTDVNMGTIIHYMREKNII
ncbi:PriCT-2 domain-containing protein [Crocinitomicaceae bacterium]|nr:PriCT-2 domain-containing protein [Crocinitomicaceae bacterium]